MSFTILSPDWWSEKYAVPQTGDRGGRKRLAWLRCQCCGKQHGLNVACEPSAAVRREAEEFARRYRGEASGRGGA